MNATLIVRQAHSTLLLRGQSDTLPVPAAPVPAVLAVDPPGRSVILAGVPGMPGRPGRDAPGIDGAPVISADPMNRITRGADDGLFVRDDLTPDPLAYYILARS